MPKSHSPRQRRFHVALGSTPTPPGIVISRMDRLRRTDEHEQAKLLVLKAATENPATAVGMLTIFHAAGRRADAEMLLRLIASADAETCGAIVHALCESADAADARALIDLLDDRPAADLAAAAAAFDRSAAAHRGPGPDRDGPGASLDNPLIARLAARPAGGLVAEIVRSRADHRDDQAAVLMAVIEQGSPLTVYAAASELAGRNLTADAGDLLVRYGQTAAPTDLARLLLRLAESWESAARHVAPVVVGRGDVAVCLAALQALAPYGPPDDYPGILAKWLTCGQIAELCRVLIGQWASDAADDLLGWCARHDDVRALQATLHHEGMHAAAYRLAERLAEITGRYEP